ncbi:Transposase IS4 [Popillia japonica]|uniref:Transposase IS4 n=1 Tax=Popillia japonica TaxID=7064 RepID=A0AAW1JF36_POPJA
MNRAVNRKFQEHGKVSTSAGAEMENFMQSTSEKIMLTAEFVVTNQNQGAEKLRWIKASPSKWQTFVANRVSKIQSHSDPQEWFHVKSQDNPADLLSRGTTLSTLLNSTLWWHGPSWLAQNSSERPINYNNSEPVAEIPEQRKTVALTTKLTEYSIFEKFSSFSKLQRITAWILRFAANCRKGAGDRRSGPLSVTELNNSLIVLVGSNTCLKIADNNAVPGPSDSTKPRLSVKKYYTDSELLKIWEDSDFDDFDSVDGDFERLRDSDKESATDVPRGNADNKESIISWKDYPTCMNNLPFLKTESLLIPPNGNTPIDYFRHIVTDDFLQTVVEETNTNSYIWKINPPPGEANPEDRLYKIRPVINFFNQRMAEIYYPCKQLFLDESMVLWRERLSFRQYIKNQKHKYGIKLYMMTTPQGLIQKIAVYTGQYIKNQKHKYGIKLYMMTTPQGLIQKIAVYTGMLDEKGDRGHAQKVVLHLMKDKLNVGHHLYVDNYYNSFDLAKTLLDQGTLDERQVKRWTSPLRGQLL